MHTRITKKLPAAITDCSSASKFAAKHSRCKHDLPRAFTAGYTCGNMDFNALGCRAWLSKTEFLAAYASFGDEASPSGIGSAHQVIENVLQYCPFVALTIRLPLPLMGSARIGRPHIKRSQYYPHIHVETAEAALNLGPLSALMVPGASSRPKTYGKHLVHD